MKSRWIFLDNSWKKLRNVMLSTLDIKIQIIMIDNRGESGYFIHDKGVHLSRSQKSRIFHREGKSRYLEM